MSVEVKVFGSEDIAEGLRKALLKHPEAKVRRGLTKAAGDLIQEAKRLAGRAKKYQNTGVLVDSIRVLRKYNRDPLGVYVGPVFKRRGGSRKPGEFGNAWYAHFVEYGTNKHNLGYKGKYVSAKGSGHPGSEEKPFMRPAYDTTQQAVIDRMMSEIEKMIMG